MARLIKPSQIKKPTAAQLEQIMKYALPGRDPEKATKALYGLWEGRDISIEKIRAAKGPMKW